MGDDEEGPAYDVVVQEQQEGQIQASFLYTS